MPTPLWAGQAPARSGLRGWTAGGGGRPAPVVGCHTQMTLLTPLHLLHHLTIDIENGVTLAFMLLSPILFICRLK